MMGKNLEKIEKKKFFFVGGERGGVWGAGGGVCLKEHQNTLLSSFFYVDIIEYVALLWTVSQDYVVSSLR